ncbi:hypothetical protein WMY93_027625 [Mugilogobius chulae]|uniref:Uncharacterized protein n=1 Tax=Mugilogobius chulae TaxID=88201 RepID=A0AAW0N5C2_9GOBI
MGGKLHPVHQIDRESVNIEGVDIGQKLRYFDVCPDLSVIHQLLPWYWELCSKQWQKSDLPSLKTPTPEDHINAAVRTEHGPPAARVRTKHQAPLVSESGLNMTDILLVLQSGLNMDRPPAGARVRTKHGPPPAGATVRTKHGPAGAKSMDRPPATVRTKHGATVRTKHGPASC